MTLDQAQQELNNILARINDTLSDGQIDALITDLENLGNQVEAVPETLEFHKMIRDTINDLADADIAKLVGNIVSRTSALSAAIGGLNEVTTHTNKVAKTLSLEWAIRLIETAKNGYDKVKSIEDAIDSGDASQINDSIEAALAYLESEKAKAEVEATKAGGTED